MATDYYALASRALELQEQARIAEEQQAAADQQARARAFAEQQARLAAEAEQRRLGGGSDFLRGITNYIPQAQTRIGNLATLGGVAAQRTFGEGALSEGLVGAGQRMVEAGQTATVNRDTDTFSGAKARGLGALLTDYVPYQVGQALGNVGEFLATRAAGAAIGGAVAGPAGAVIGGVAGPALSAATQGYSSTTGRAVQEAQATGGNAYDIDLGRTLAAGTVSTGLEYVGDRLMGNAALGRSMPSPVTTVTTAPGVTRAVTQGASPTLAALGVGVREVPVEIGQQAAERYAAGLSLTGEGSGTEYLDAGVGGFVGGTAAGGVGAAVNYVRRPTPARAQLDQARAEQEQTLAADGASPLQPSFLESFVGPQPRGEQFNPQTFVGPSLPATGPAPFNPATAFEQPAPAPYVNRGVLESRVDLPSPAPVLDVERLGRAVDLNLPRPADLPLEDVLATYGPAAAGREFVARQQPAAAPVDHRRAVRQALASRLNEDVASVRGAEVNRLADALQAAGVTPASPDFDGRVAELVDQRLAANPNSQSSVLGKLSNAFPVLDAEQAAVDRAFEREGVAGSEADVFGPAPLPTVDTATGLPTVPAAEVARIEKGQVWLDPQGNEYNVRMAQGGGSTGVLVPVAGGNGSPRKLTTLRNNGWVMRPAPQVEGLGSADVLAELQTALDSTYWQERGGRLLRANGTEGEVTGRTAWLSSFPEVQRVLTDYGSNPTAVRELIERAATGKGRKLTDKQKALVSDLLTTLNDLKTGEQQAEAADAAVEAAALADPVLQERLAEQAVPAADLANLIARLDAAVNSANNDAELEANVIAARDAVRADPGYAALSDADWQSLENHIATVVGDVFGPKFELSERRPLANPVSRALFAKGVITAASNVGRVQGFDTVAELEAAVGFPIPANAKGMYWNGSIYLVRENLASAKDLAYTLAHEVGHGGLGQLLGDSLTAATNRLWANPALRQRIKRKQAELGDGATRAVAAEEVLADMLASGERLNKDIWAKLRAGVREFFARVFGLRGVAISNAEVDALLGDVARVIRGAPAAQVRATMANPALWLDNPVLAAQQDPKFAKVRTDIDRALADAANETEGSVVPFDRLTKAAGEAGVDAVKALGQALKMGKVGEVWTHYMMHLDHLVAFHDKAFGGRLGTVAKLKELQQAEFNRTLAEDKARTFKPGKGPEKALGKASINATLETWEKFRAANPARGALLDYVQTESTFYKLFPTLPWDQQSTVDYAAEGFTMGQRKAAYDAVTRAYQQMGDTARSLYQQSQAMYADLDAKRWRVLLDEVDRQGKLTEEVVTDKEGHQRTIARIKGILHTAMKASKAGSYSPLQRYGKYLATVRNALGEVVYFAGYDSQAEADAALDTVLEARKQAGETGLTGNTSIEQKFDWSSVGVSAGTIEQLRRDAEDVIPAGLDQQTRQVVLNTLTTGLVEAYLQALPTKSFLKHALSRKNVAGYDGDSLRGFANYAIRAARNIASIKYDGQIDSALVQINQYVKDVEAGKYLAEGQDRTDTTKLREVAAAVRQQHLAAVDHQTSAFVSAATGASFTYMMTSPSQLFMNATQTLLVTLPRMMAHYAKRGGEARVAKEILRAAADYAKSRGDLLGPQSVLTRPDATAADKLAHAALTRIREDGPLDQSQAHDIAGIADGSADALSPYWGKVMKWLSYFMHKSETFNRQVTALAAARLEQQGQTPPAEGSADYARRREALAESGKDWIRTTHFNYDKYNKPVALNTQVGTLLGQFRQYQIHMLSTLARDIRDAELGKAALFKEPMNKQEAAIARRTLSYMLGAQLAFTGAAGTILAPVAFAIADAFRSLDDDEELVDSKTEFAAMVPTWAMHGLFGLFTDTNRVSAATLLPIIGQRDYAPIGGKASESFAYYLTQNLGPSYGLTKNLLDGSQSVVNGDFYQAGQKLLPKPAADAVKALYEGQNGAQDMRGVMYGQPSIWSGVNQLVGLRSAERRDLEQPRGVAYQVNQRAYLFKEQAKTRLALAQATGDMELYNETLAEVQAFNSQYPDYRIRPAELVSAVRARMRTENVAAATGVVSSRLPGPTLDAYLGR